MRASRFTEQRIVATLRQAKGGTPAVTFYRGLGATELPIWLFSNGAFGHDATDIIGNDRREVAVPMQIAELTSAIAP